MPNKKPRTAFLCGGCSRKLKTPLQDFSRLTLQKKYNKEYRLTNDEAADLCRRFDSYSLNHVLTKSTFQEMIGQLGSTFLCERMFYTMAEKNGTVVSARDSPRRSRRRASSTTTTSSCTAPTR